MWETEFIPWLPKQINMSSMQVSQVWYAKTTGLVCKNQMSGMQEPKVGMQESQVLYTKSQVWYAKNTGLVCKNHRSGIQESQVWYARITNLVCKNHRSGMKQSQVW